MADQPSNCVVIVGGGIGGLTLALALHQRGVPFKVYEAAPDIKPLGVGLNLLPHAMKQLYSIGIGDKLLKKGIETREYAFFNRHGQLIYREPRGKFAEYDWPQVSIHRGDLHMTLLDEVLSRAGKDAVVLNHRCVDIQHADSGAKVVFSTGERAVATVQGDAVIACDGVHSVARVKMHPKEAVPRYEGTIQYRGTTRWMPFMTGATMIYMGTVKTGKLILYPIRKDIDEQGRQLLNWVIEVEKDNVHLIRDWNREGSYNEFLNYFINCNFDWLDIPSVLSNADKVFEYPMIDQQPLPYWTEGRITLLGDAAHPMMPRGSNGAAQAIIDAITLADLLAKCDDWGGALKEYQDIRLEATSRVVLANRSIAPDGIIQEVEDRTGGMRFENLSDVISPAELAAWQERYRNVAGFSKDMLK